MEQDILKNLGDKLVANLKSVLQRKNKRATGTLIDSIVPQIIVQQDQSRLEILMADYATFVDQGRRPGGKLVPLNSIKEWARIKGIPQSAAYGIAKNIQKFGIPATNFVREGLSLSQQEIQNILGEGYTEEIEKEISESILVDAKISIGL